MPLSAASWACAEISADVLVGGETPAHIVGIEPAIGRRLHQHVDVGEIAAVAEIQFHQPLLHLGGFADRFGPVNQPVAIDGVGLALDEIGPVDRPSSLAAATTRPAMPL